MAITIVAAGLLAYHNSLHGPFLFDDLRAIPENPHLRHLWPLWGALTAPFSTAASGRPVVSLSLALNYAVGGLNVVGYHAFNLTVHVLTALVLFGVVRRTLSRAALRRTYGQAASSLAFATSVIWVVHPMLSEAVDYTIQRTELLMGLCFLLTLYCAIRSFSAVASRVGQWHAAAVASCALGMGSKEVMVTAPLLVLLYDWLFESPSFSELYRRRGRLYAGLAATWLLLVTLVATTPRRGAGWSFEHLTLGQYVMTQCGVILYYLRLTLWPHPLALDYDGWPIAQTLADVTLTAPALLGLVAVTLWLLRHRSPAGYLGAWFFLILAPTSSVLPIATEIAAERRMYLPLAGVIVGVVVGGWRLLSQRFVAPHLRRLVAVSLSSLLVVVLAAITIRRNRDYRSAIVMWSDVVAKRPNDGRAHYDLGNELSAVGELDEAVAHYTTALQIQPTFPEAHNNLGAALAKQGKLQEAIGHHMAALQLQATFPEAHNNLGLVLVKQGKYEQAKQQFDEALRQRPGFAEAHYNLGNVHVRLQQLESAETSFRQALQSDPSFAMAHNNLGLILAVRGEVAAAIAHYTEALRLQPDLVEAHRNLADALMRQGRYEEALRHLSEALTQDPNFTRKPKMGRTGQ